MMRARLAVLAAMTTFSLGALACGGNATNTPRKPVATTAAEHYAQGQKLEKAGKVKEAVASYERAAKGNHGPSLLALANIYNRGHPEVQRDYERYLVLLDRAKAQGEEVRSTCR